MNSQIKQCQNCKKDFMIEPEDFLFYEKIQVPPPTFCPECRMQRRFMFRNDRMLYKRKSDYSNNEIFSMFPSQSSLKIYEREIWWSDKWDSMIYSQDYDFNKTFFEQFYSLLQKVPLPNMNVNNMINSDYCTNAHDLKNCYLLFDSAYSEDSAYGNKVIKSQNCFDNSHLNQCELCYEDVMVKQSSKIFFSYNCENCLNIYFSRNLVNCSECVGCINLRNQSYCIFNKKYSKEEYFEKLQKLNFRSFKNFQLFKLNLESFRIKFPEKYIQARQTFNVSGDYIYESKNVFSSWIVFKGENCKYCQLIPVGPTKDCYDYTIYGENNELCYETLTSGKGSKILFSYDCFPNCNEIYYCFNCHSSSNLFGCIGLRHKEYCILNKQYTKEEYERLVPKIIEHMNSMPYVSNYRSSTSIIYKYGEFFPPELSPFCYNETIAQEYFPLTKEQALEKGYQWKDPEQRNIQIDIKTEDLPDNIKDVDDDIVGKIIECANVKCQISNIESDLNVKCLHWSMLYLTLWEWKYVDK